ncbi:hypothetical protein [Fibrella aquatica]|uniref:hypothetical protein n=1 Tax=Fibrella aquatica TaxID=3242487 RepID=UPI0035217DA3
MPLIVQRAVGTQPSHVAYLRHAEDREDLVFYRRCAVKPLPGQKASLTSGKLNAGMLLIYFVKS